MTYKEEYGDLFKVLHVTETNEGYWYAHCIASDLGMGAGIAVPMQEKFELRKALSTAPKYMLEHPTTIMTPGVFNMISKQKSNGKPKYEDFITSLKIVRNMCWEYQVKKLAMPTIGCGLDKLSWDVVSALIKDLFKDLDIEILVVKYDPT